MTSSSVKTENTNTLSTITTGLTSGLEKVGKGISKIFSDSEGLGLVAELFHSIVTATKPEPGKAPSGTPVAKWETSLNGFSGFLTILTFVADKVKWFVPDSNGKYLIDKKPIKIVEQFMWETVHDIDLINWLRSVKAIDSNEGWLNFLSVAGTALKGAIAGLTFFLSLRNIDNARVAKTNYEISKVKWEKYKSFTENQWVEEADKKFQKWEEKAKSQLFYLSGKSNLIEVDAARKTDPKLAKKLLADKTLAQCKYKASLWKEIGKEAAKVIKEPNKECSIHFLAAMKSFADKMRANYTIGIENQNSKIIRNTICLVLCAAIVTSVFVTIGLQASSTGGLWGMPSHSVPFLALSIGTSVLYLTEFVVRIHFEKTRLRQLKPDFHHHHHALAQCNRPLSKF